MLCYPRYDVGDDWQRRDEAAENGGGRSDGSAPCVTRGSKAAGVGVSVWTGREAVFGDAVQCMTNLTVSGQRTTYGGGGAVSSQEVSPNKQNWTMHQW